MQAMATEIEQLQAEAHAMREQCHRAMGLSSKLQEKLAEHVEMNAVEKAKVQEQASLLVQASAQRAKADALLEEAQAKARAAKEDASVLQDDLQTFEEARGSPRIAKYVEGGRAVCPSPTTIVDRIFEGRRNLCIAGVHGIPHC